MAAGAPSPPITDETQLPEARKSSGLLLGDRCRVISVGLLAVIWALFTGDSKSTLAISVEVKRLLIWTAAVSIGVLLSDYLQALFQFLDASAPWRKIGPIWNVGGKFMFGAKQILTLLAVGLFLVAACNIVAPEAVEAENGIWNSWWVGKVWSDATPGVQKESKLVLGEPNPYSGLIPAREDKFECNGSTRQVQPSGQSTAYLELKLNCASGITLVGSIRGDKRNTKFAGTWASTDPSKSETGHFEYTYLRKKPDYF